MSSSGSVKVTSTGGKYWNVSNSIPKRNNNNDNNNEGRDSRGNVSSTFASTSTTATMTVTTGSFGFGGSCAANGTICSTAATTALTTTNSTIHATAVAAAAASGNGHFFHGSHNNQHKIVPPRPTKSIAAKKGEDTTKLLKYIDDNVVGKNGTFFGPYGRRKIVYCDYTASGRSLQFLEDYIIKEVLPCLGDTRASTSICSLQSSLFRHEARDIVRHAVGAGEQDAVLFSGQGTAGALRTLLRHLNLSQSTIVFVGPFEHHSNLRPWRELGVKIVRVAETKEGFLDLNDLEKNLIEARADGVVRMVGCFSAASCITGVLADDVATTLLLHQYGALSVWDYTTAAPYVQVDMNPHLPGVGETAVHKDAIIFSGHKFIGGVQSPGVLIVKRSLLREDVFPEDMRDSHRYLQDPELRDESGTAGVVETIRMGLVCQLKENVTPRAIIARQDKISKQVLSHVRTIPELILLGSTSQNVKRLPIFSFMVRHSRGTFLHHNFVCAVLNDVFGVQARGGCACTGRYAHDLMGIDADLAKEYESVLLETDESTFRLSDEDDEECESEALRPGFARLSFPYFMSESEVGYVLEALKMVATEGWKLLPQYVLNADTGEWRHHTNSVFKERKWLSSIRYTDGKMNTSERRISGSTLTTSSLPQNYADCLQTARNIFNRARKIAQRYPLKIEQQQNHYKFLLNNNERYEKLRWFMLPSEAQDLLLGNSQNVKQSVPFDPLFCLRKLQLENAAFLQNCSIRRLNSDIPKSGNSHALPNSPRHRSLPVIPTRPIIGKMMRTASETDNDFVRLREGEELETNPDESKSKKLSSTCPNSPIPVRFALGEAVTNPSIFGTSLNSKEQRPGGLLSNANCRIRCNSLGSGVTDEKIEKNGDSKNLGAMLSLSPQILTNLGLQVSGYSNPTKNRRRLNCSCSSQTELDSIEFDFKYASLNHIHQRASSSSPSSFTSIVDRPDTGRSSPSNHKSEDDQVQAYVKELTEELATEIKSEIREVISKVDDALSESNTCENTPHHSKNPAGFEAARRHDSFTVNDIAEYLMEFSKEKPNSLPESTTSSGCESPDRALFGTPKKFSNKLNEISTQDSKMSSECSSDETVIYVIKSGSGKDAQRQTSSDCDDLEDDDETLEIDGSSKKSTMSSIDDVNSKKILPKIYSAVNSVSSQDSGINLSFHENERSLESIELRRSSSSDSNSINGGFNIKKSNKKWNNAKNYENDLSEDEESPSYETESCNNFPSFQGSLDESDECLVLLENADANLGGKKERPAPLENEMKNVWHCPSKNIWKPTVEAIQEFNMIKDQDRILVCLKPYEKNSLSLLHSLRQYRCYIKSKGVRFEIGAATVEGLSRSISEDPMTLMSYLKGLDVPFYYETEKESVNNRNEEYEEMEYESNGNCSFSKKSIRRELYSIARNNGYNVLALGQNLDDLTESFLNSLFHGGKLSTMKAHYSIRKEDLRVIRPFVYVREKSIGQFAESRKLPVRSLHAEDQQRVQEKRNQSKELIAQQEKNYPRFYWSLRAALRPFIEPTNSASKLSNSGISPTSFSNAIDNCIGATADAAAIAKATAMAASTATATAAIATPNSTSQQKRYRRIRTTSALSVQSSSQSIEDSEETTDEEPVLL